MRKLNSKNTDKILWIPQGYSGPSVALTPPLAEGKDLTNPPSPKTNKHQQEGRRENTDRPEQSISDARGGGQEQLEEGTAGEGRKG